jgi:hypothetical protein
MTGDAPRLGVDIPDMDRSGCSYNLGCLRGLVPIGLAPAAAPVKSRLCLLLRRVAWASAAGLMMQQDHREGVWRTRRCQRWHTKGRVVLNHVNLEAAILCDAMCKASGEQKPSARAVKSSTRTSSVAASAGDKGRAPASAVTSIGNSDTELPHDRKIRNTRDTGTYVCRGQGYVYWCNWGLGGPAHPTYEPENAPCRLKIGFLSSCDDARHGVIA